MSLINSDCKVLPVNLYEQNEISWQQKVHQVLSESDCRKINVHSVGILQHVTADRIAQLREVMGSKLRPDQ